MSSVGEPEEHRGLPIDTRERRGDQRHDLGRLAENHRRERHRVDTAVEKHATAELVCEETERRIFREPLAVIGHDCHDVTKRAGGDQTIDFGYVRQEPCPHRLHREQLLGARGGDQLASLIGVHGERFLHQHRLAGVEREQRVGEVHRVWCRHVDNIHVRVSHQRLVGGVTVGDAELVGESVGRLLAA